jgi:hypothetical protein
MERIMSTRGALLSLALCAIVASWSARAWAQPTPGEKKPAAAKAGDKAKGDAKGGGDEAKDDSPKVKVERGAGGKKVYRITTGFVIEGRIQKPNAFYVLQRSQINYDWATLKEDFIPRIVEAVKRSPF